MTHIQAHEIVEMLEKRLHPSKIWSLRVDDIRGNPNHARIVIHTIGGDSLVIYSARPVRVPTRQVP